MKSDKNHITKNRIKKHLMYCDLEKDQYESVADEIWVRNDQILTAVSFLAITAGLIFFVINLLSGSGKIFPYVFLMSGSTVIAIIHRFMPDNHRQRWSRVLSYIQMVFICIYACILSTQPSNYDLPATSIAVFIALLPICIDDRPARMYAAMLLESFGYLTVSYFAKSRSAFALDVTNIMTFCFFGMIIYGVICTRNVREIYQSAHVKKIQRNSITSLATIVEERDEMTGGHIIRTEDYVEQLVRRLRKLEKYSEQSDEYWNNIIMASPMHDVGKIKIPDSILNKPGKLTEEEFEIMKKHAEYGGEIIMRTVGEVADKEYSKVAANIARYHHERYDGTGYPEGLKGEEIPLPARIMSLADVYDALISERVYKKAFPKDKAMRIISEGSGTQFDPELVPLFLECVK